MVACFQENSVVREHYLHDDIACGALFCPTCDKSRAKLRETTRNIVVIDTNVALHQMDLLEKKVMSVVVVLSVVLEEVTNKNLSIYNRLRTVIDNPVRHFFVFANENQKDTYIKALPNETPNDRNDRALRVASQWYQHHLGAAKVLLLTNDNDNRRKAREEVLLLRQLIHMSRRYGNLNCWTWQHDLMPWMLTGNL